MASPRWIQRLQDRWQLPSAWQVLIVLLVFSCTGFTIMFLKPVITGWLFDGEHPTWFSILYWILIFPIYNMFLLFYGFIFGQFKFFWAFEKRFLGRIFGKRAPQSKP